MKAFFAFPDLAHPPQKSRNTGYFVSTILKLSEQIQFSKMALAFGICQNTDYCITVDFC